MAVKGTTVKSAGSVDYSIDKDILDRVKEANRMTGEDRPNLGRNIDQLTKKVTDYAAAKQKEWTDGNELWNDGFESVDGRQSWASPELYDKFQLMEKDHFLVEYQNAIKSGDKALAAKLLKDQQGRSAQIQSWKALVENTQDTYDKNLWSKNISNEDQFIINAINKQQGDAFDIAWGEDNSMIFKIKTADGGTIDVTQNDYQKIVARNLAPIEIKNNWLQATDQLMQIARTAPVAEFDQDVYNSQLVNNKEMITRDNYRSLFYNDITNSATTFAEDFEYHPDIKNISFDSLGINYQEVKTWQGGDLDPQGRKTKGRGYWWYDGDPTIFYDGIKFESEEEYFAHRKANGFSEDYSGITQIDGSRQYKPDANGDGILSEGEYQNLSALDKQKVIDFLAQPENYDIGREYIAEYLTLKQKYRFDKERTNYAEYRETQANKKNKGKYD